MQKGIGAIHILVILVLLVLAGSVGYIYTRPKQEVPKTFESKNETTAPQSFPATQSESDLILAHPNGGEVFSLNQSISITYKIAEAFKRKLAPNDLIEFYLLSEDNVLLGYIGGVEDKNSDTLIWDTKSLLHNGGLDMWEAQTPEGRYRILILSRHPFFCTPDKGECGVDTVDDPSTKFIDGYLCTSTGVGCRIVNGHLCTPELSYELRKDNDLSCKGAASGTELLASDISDSLFTIK